MIPYWFVNVTATADSDYSLIKIYMFELVGLLNLMFVKICKFHDMILVTRLTSY